jgi:transcriptional regulator with XRE-family HTH domain
MVTFGSFIRSKRQEAGYSNLTEFAKLLGISPAYWSRVENDKEKPPTDELIKKAAEILKMNADELFIEAERFPPDMQERAKIEAVVRLYRELPKPKK